MDMTFILLGIVVVVILFVWFFLRHFQILTNRALKQKALSLPTPKTYTAAKPENLEKASIEVGNREASSNDSTLPPIKALVMFLVI